MGNAATDGVAVRLDEGNDAHNLIVTDLVAPIGHVQASLRLIEAAIAREALLAEQQADAAIVVLDDPATTDGFGPITWIVPTTPNP